MVLPPLRLSQATLVIVASLYMKVEMAEKLPGRHVVCLLTLFLVGSGSALLIVDWLRRATSVINAYFRLASI